MTPAVFVKSLQNPQLFSMTAFKIHMGHFKFASLNKVEQILLNGDISSDISCRFKFISPVRVFIFPESKEMFKMVHTNLRANH